MRPPLSGSVQRAAIRVDDFGAYNATLDAVIALGADATMRSSCRRMILPSTSSLNGHVRNDNHATEQRRRERLQAAAGDRGLTLKVDQDDQRR